MRFKVDENLPGDVVAMLAAAGHDAVTVLDQGMGGQPDVNISSVIVREGRALVTLDLDFADIRTYPPGQYPGLLVLRVDRQDKASVLGCLARVLPMLVHEPVNGRLWIVGEKSVRMRGDASESDPIGPEE